MSEVYQTFFAFYTFLFSPLVILLLICSYLCRCIIEIILRIQLKDKFVGLLDGMDCVWAVEQSSALSVNNILMILEKDARHSNINFLESFRDLVRNRIVCSSFEKLLYKRKRKFGYYFWERSEEIDLRERIRWLEYERTNCDGSCDNIYNSHLKKVLWNICNQPLPENHTASWEILIGKCCPRLSHHYLRRMEERLTNKIKIPILFRVHHSLGDGMALLKFFRDVIIDKEPVPETFLQLDSSLKMKNEKTKKQNVIVSLMSPANGENNLDNNSFQKKIMSASMPFIHFTMFSYFFLLLWKHFNTWLKYLQNVTLKDLKCEMKMFLRTVQDRLKVFFSEMICKKIQKGLKMAKIIINLPGCLIQQAFRSMDKRFVRSAFNSFLFYQFFTIKNVKCFILAHSMEQNYQAKSLFHTGLKTISKMPAIKNCLQKYKI